MASPEDSAVSVTSDTEALLPGDSDQNEPEKLESTADFEESTKTSQTNGLLFQLKKHPVILFVQHWWQLLVIVATPVLFLPLPLAWNDDAKVAEAAYVIIIIAIYWVTEVIPIAATALLPLVLFPALGIISARDAAREYLGDTNMLFAGWLMMAVAIEKWNLHKRIALLVLMFVGSKPKWLLFGFMVTTAFLSMWISNTATAAMMLPIAHAVLGEIKDENRLTVTRDDHGATRTTSPQDRIVLKMYKSNENQEGQFYLEEMSPQRSVASMLTRGEEGVQPGQPAGDEVRESSFSAEPESKNVEIEDKKSNVVSNGVKEQGNGLNDTAVQVSEVDIEARKQGSTTNLPNGVGFGASHNETVFDTKTDTGDKAFQRLAKVLMLGIAYSANIGGTATLTGTGPNLVFSGDANRLFPYNPGVNFGLWFLFAAPAMVLALFCAWLYLSLLYCDDSFHWCKKRLFKNKVYFLQSQRAKQVIREQYKKLGRIRYAEVLVLILFFILVLLWLFREPKFIPGWGSIFETDEAGRSYFTDTSTVLLIVLLLFMIPSEPCFYCITRRGSCTNCIKAGSSPRLLDWDSVQHKLPWNIVILLGSGFAIAAASQESGLSDWLGDRLQGLEHLPRPAIALTVSIMVALVTEFISNIATTTLFLPVLAQLAINLCINPLYLMISATISASYAFMLPVATPPNAIAFSYGYIKVYDMVLTGIFMNFMCIGIITLAINTLGVAIFDLTTFPDWATNSTASGCINTTIVV